LCTFVCPCYGDDDGGTLGAIEYLVKRKLYILVGGSNVSMRGVEKQELKRKGSNFDGSRIFLL
jgi:hypothetical protein